MKIKVYSTPTCPFCIKVKEFLNQKNVDFEDIDVAQDEEARNEMVKKSNQMGVPVVIVEKDGEEHIIVGFEKERLEELLS